MLYNGPEGVNNMAEAHKFTTLEKATETFPELPWKQSYSGKVWVFDAKEDSYVPVAKGQYIVSIGDRFEVADEEPAKAKKAEAPKKTEPESRKSNETPKADEPNAHESESIAGGQTQTSEEIK